MGETFAISKLYEESLDINIKKSKGVYYILGIYCLYVLSKTITLQIVTSKNLSGNFLSYILSFKNVLISSFIMIITVISIQFLLSSFFSSYLLLVISVLFGGFSFVLSIKWIDRKIINDLISIVLHKKLPN